MKQNPSNLPGRTVTLLVLLVTAPLLGWLYLIHQWIGVPFLPVVLGDWLLVNAPRPLVTAGYAVIVAGLLTLNQEVDRALVPLGQGLGILLLAAACSLIGRLLWQVGKRRSRLARFGAGLCGGGLWGVLLSIVTLPQTSIVVNQITLPQTGTAGWLLLPFLLWGGTLSWLSGRLLEQQVEWTPTVSPPELVDRLTRRQLLARTAAGATLLTLLTTGAGRVAAQSRRNQHETVMSSAMSNPPHFPPTLRARVFRSESTPVFPELPFHRYQPAQRPFGVCFSGGGSRAMAAALGQMRGLHALGLLDAVGAVSAVSGGAWFSTLWSYAPTNLSDETLLGPVRAPETLTPQNLAAIDPHCIAAPWTTLSTARILNVKTEAMIAATRSATQAFNRVYARTLNELLLKPFALDDPHRFFTLDAATVDQIIAQNPALRPSDFYTMRPDRPFLIVNLAQTWPLGENAVSRHFEATPLYTGAPQAFPGAGPDGVDIGGGYVESFAFDSVAPLTQTQDGYVTVPTPNPPFLLSDLIGSASAAPAILLNYYQKPEWFPKFNHWSPLQIGAQPAQSYSVIDAGATDNLGIVPLLHRQYPIILAFVNAEAPLGSTDPLAAQGISHPVARLFGVLPPAERFAAQDRQIFPTDQFPALVAGLSRAKTEGRTPIFVDAYPIVQPNPFGIASYPDSGPGQGKVTVVWFYNDRNQGWVDQLSPEVRNLLRSSDPTHYLTNFPHYDLFHQNHNALGVPQLLHLSAQQINLLAHMWCYNVMHDAQELLQTLLMRFDTQPR